MNGFRIWFVTTNGRFAHILGYNEDGTAKNTVCGAIPKYWNNHTTVRIYPARGSWSQEDWDKSPHRVGLDVLDPDRVHSMHKCKKCYKNSPEFVQDVLKTYGWFV